MTKQTIATKRLRQWGTYAFARHCFNLGISFEDAYFLIFGKEPREWN